MSDTSYAPPPPGFAVGQEPLRRTLVTPEGVDLGLKLASAGQRMGALLLDLMLILVSLIAMTLILLALGFAAGGGMTEFIGEALTVIWLLGWFVIRSGYFIVMESGARAATLGKRIVGIRVIARSGERLSTESVVARNLMREIEVFLPIAAIVAALVSSIMGDPAMAWLGVVWVLIFALFPLFNKDRLRVGDLLAGTWVVEVPKRRLGYDLTAAAPEVPIIAFTPEQLDVYGVYEIQTLEGVLRLGQAETMRTVSDTIRQKIQYWGHEDDWTFLNAYYTAARTRMERGLLFGKRRAHKYDR